MRLDQLGTASVVTVPFFFDFSFLALPKCTVFQNRASVLVLQFEWISYRCLVRPWCPCTTGAYFSEKYTCRWEIEQRSSGSGNFKVVVERSMVSG